MTNASTETKPKAEKPEPTPVDCLCSKLDVQFAPNDRMNTGCAERVVNRKYAVGHDAKLKSVIFQATRRVLKDKKPLNSVAWTFGGSKYAGPVELAKANLSEALQKQVAHGVERATAEANKPPKEAKPKSATSGGKSTGPRKVLAKVGNYTFEGRAYTDGTFRYKDKDDNEVEVAKGDWSEVTPAEAAANTVKTAAAAK